MHKRGIALAIRDGKVKPRGVGNLTAPQEDALRIHSVNAGRDMDNAEDLTFVTSALIAFAAGLYSLAGGGLELLIYYGVERDRAELPPRMVMALLAQKLSSVVVHVTFVTGSVFFCTLSTFIAHQLSFL